MASSQNQSSIRAVFGALFLALWLAALDQTVVSTALPTMVGPSLAHAVIPAPSQCLGRYHGKLIVRYVTNIHAACPGNLYANACNYRFPNLCVIYLPRGASRALYKHEYAHCNCERWH